MLPGVLCLEKGKELGASAALRGEGGEKALLCELYPCSVRPSGCIDRAKCCLFALLSMKIQPREGAFSVSPPALSIGILRHHLRAELGGRGRDEEDAPRRWASASSGLVACGAIGK